MVKTVTEFLFKFLCWKILFGSEYWHEKNDNHEYAVKKLNRIEV